MTQSPSAPNEEGFLISHTLSSQPMLTIVITPDDTEDLQQKQSEGASNAFLAADGISSLFYGTVSALIETDDEAAEEEAKEGSELLQKQLPILIEEGEAAVTFLEHFNYANTQYTIKQTARAVTITGGTTGTTTIKLAGGSGNLIFGDGSTLAIGAVQGATEAELHLHPSWRC